MAYRLSVPSVSAVQVVYDTMDSLLYGIREVLEGLDGIGDSDPVTVIVESVQMTPEQMATLPEFDGY